MQVKDLIVEELKLLIQETVAEIVPREANLLTFEQYRAELAKIRAIEEE